MSVIAEKATVRAFPDGVIVDVPLAGESGPRAAKRRIVVRNAAINAFLGGGETVGRMTDAQRENCVRNNLARVLRRAVEICRAKAAIPALPIDAPHGRGLPELIHIGEGEL